MDLSRSPQNENPFRIQLVKELFLVLHEMPFKMGMQKKNYIYIYTYVYIFIYCKNINGIVELNAALNMKAS